MSVAESCLEVGLYLGSLGLQTLIRPIVDRVFVRLPTVVVGVGVIQPDYQPGQLLTTSQNYTAECRAEHSYSLCFLMK